MNMNSLNIKNCTKEELAEILGSLGQPKYRAAQLYEWFHKHNATSYDQMTNLPKNLRNLLKEEYPLEEQEVLGKACSADGSRKYQLKLADGNVVEMVGITAREHPISSQGNDSARLTVCFSTQVGCALKCEFCATGRQGFTRNLSADEMVAQVVSVSKDFGYRASNIVAMGQGEPFSNYDALMDALRRMNKDEGLGVGARHITVSTSGMVEGIYEFAEEPEQFRLAISLHSANQATRNLLMPRLDGQPLRKLKKALEYYCDVKGRRVTLEYMLLDGINDSKEELDSLIRFCNGLKAHINLIPFNKVDGVNYRPSDSQTSDYWSCQLQQSRIPVSIRHSKGSDIAGACGQLIYERQS